MIRKGIALFLLYVILVTFAPELAAMLVGMVIAVTMMVINLLAAFVRPFLSQISSRDVTNGAASIFLTGSVVLALFAWKPVVSRIRQVKK